MRKDIIIFGVDMSASVHTDNKGKDIFILGKRPIQLNIIVLDQLFITDQL